MGYQGHEQVICANGHYDEIDAYDYDTKVCTTCGAKFVHTHRVDQTNDDGEPREVIETEPAVYFDTKAKMVAMLNPMLSSDEVVKLLNEIMANTTPHRIEKCKVKFGKIIKLTHR